MFKYLLKSPTGTQKNSRGRAAQLNKCRKSNALSSFADAPPVPRLPTGNSPFLPHPYQSLSETLSGGYRAARIARRYARPNGSLS